MKKVLRIVLYVFLSLALIASVFASWYVYEAYIKDHTTHYRSCGEVVPVSVPFPVQYGGYEMTCKFLIEEEDVYVLSLRYFYERGDNVREIAGGKDWGAGNAQGGPMSIQYRIKSLDTGEVIKEGINGAPKIHSFGVYKWGVNDANATVVAARYTPGLYEFTVKSLKNVPQMAGIRTDILMSVRGGK